MDDEMREIEALLEDEARDEYELYEQKLLKQEFLNFTAKKGP